MIYKRALSRRVIALFIGRGTSNFQHADMKSFPRRDALSPFVRTILSLSLSRAEIFQQQWFRGGD